MTGLIRSAECKHEVNGLQIYSVTRLHSEEDKAVILDHGTSG